MQSRMQGMDRSEEVHCASLMESSQSSKQVPKRQMWVKVYAFRCHCQTWFVFVRGTLSVEPCHLQLYYFVPIKTSYPKYSRPCPAQSELTRVPWPWPYNHRRASYGGPEPLFYSLHGSETRQVGAECPFGECSSDLWDSFGIQCLSAWTLFCGASSNFCQSPQIPFHRSWRMLRMSSMTYRRSPYERERGCC